MLVLVWLVRRFVPGVREGFDAEVSSQMLGVVASLFGLLFAFVIVIAYQNFTDAQGNVSDEADALAAVVRDSGAFPQPQRDHVRAAVGAYVRAVVDEEWPRMRQGKDSAARMVGRRRHVRGASGIRPGLAAGDGVLRRFRAAAEHRARSPGGIASTTRAAACPGSSAH